MQSQLKALTVTRENWPLHVAAAPMYALMATTSPLNAISGMPFVQAATCVAPEASPTPIRKFELSAVTPCMSGCPASFVPSVWGEPSRVVERPF